MSKYFALSKTAQLEGLVEATAADYLVTGDALRNLVARISQAKDRNPVVPAEARS